MRPLPMVGDRLEGEEEEPAAGILDIILIERAVIADVGELEAVGDAVSQLLSMKYGAM